MSASLSQQCFILTHIFPFLSCHAESAWQLKKGKICVKIKGIYIWFQFHIPGILFKYPIMFWQCQANQAPSMLEDMYRFPILALAKIIPRHLFWRHMAHTFTFRWKWAEKPVLRIVHNFSFSRIKRNGPNCFVWIKWRRHYNKWGGKGRKKK